MITVLSRNLKILRKQKNLTQQQMANILNVSQQAYARYEKGDREPDLSTLIKLAEFFKISLDYLSGRYVEPTFNTQSVNQMVIGQNIKQNINQSIG